MNIVSVVETDTYTTPSQDTIYFTRYSNGIKQINFADVDLGTGLVFIVTDAIPTKWRPLSGVYGCAFTANNHLRGFNLARGGTLMAGPSDSCDTGFYLFAFYV